MPELAYSRHPLPRQASKSTCSYVCPVRYGVGCHTMPQQSIELLCLALSQGALHSQVYETERFIDGQTQATEVSSQRHSPCPVSP